MHFLGTLGTIAFVIGFVILTYLSVYKIFHKGYGMTDRPLFYFGILSLIIGTQLFVTGFLAELVSRTSSNRNYYVVSKKLGIDKQMIEEDINVDV